jgi:tRNA 2-thiouridine synthesizing protein A
MATPASPSAPQSAPQHTLVDSRGSSCPGPITDLSMAYRRSKVGDVIELWATDPGVTSDARAWAERTGNPILSLEEADGKIAVVIEIRRR